MATKQFAAILLTLSLVSCSDSQTRNESHQEIPKALTENSSSYRLVSKRGYEDLVDRLYNELVSKDQNLKELEDNISDLNESLRDTTKLIDEFKDRNEAYFGAANGRVLQIKDSVLRSEIRNMVAAQLIKYNTRIIRHNQLLKVIDAKQTTIADLHNALKILRTLPLIDQYQKSSLPNAKSLEGYIKRQEEAIRLTENLSKK